MLQAFWCTISANENLFTPRSSDHLPLSKQQGSPPSMADYGFRLMSGSGGGNNGGGRDFPDQVSQRSAAQEFSRFRHRRGEAGENGASSSRDARAAAGDAAAVAAAALGMPSSGPPYGGGLRSRAHGHPLSTDAASAAAAAASGFGPGEGEPWFALRPSQPSRQLAVAMSAARAGREAFARGHLSGRRCVQRRLTAKPTYLVAGDLLCCRPCVCLCGSFVACARDEPLRGVA